MSDDDITYDEQDKPLEDSDNVVDINEWAAMKYDKVREEDMKKMQEYEQNYILTPLWEALVNIKSSRQAINAAMGMLITAKDILVLELGKEVAKTTVDSLNYDMIDLVNIEKRDDGNTQEIGYDIKPSDESVPAPNNDNNVHDITENTNLEFTKTERGDDGEKDTD